MYIINRVKGEGGGRRDVIQPGICYGSVAMKGGGGGRFVNEGGRVGEGGGCGSVVKTHRPVTWV